MLCHVRLAVVSIRDQLSFGGAGTYAWAVSDDVVGLDQRIGDIHVLELDRIDTLCSRVVGRGLRRISLYLATLNSRHMDFAYR